MSPGPFRDVSPVDLTMNLEARRNPDGTPFMRKENFMKKKRSTPAPVGKHLEIYESSNGLWRYRLIAANNRNTGNPGEGYSDRSGARRAAKRDHPGVPIVVVVGRKRR